MEKEFKNKDEILDSDFEEKIEEKDEKNVKSQEFIDSMNNFITNDAKAQSIDTTGWAKWIVGTNGYPTLDLKTTWNGNEWNNSNNRF